jgi:hypothetical protein
MNDNESLAVMPGAFALMPVMDIKSAKLRRDQFKEFVSEILNDGTDYGKIPGTDKNTLLKPGAEKLLSLFGLTVRLTCAESIEDWTGEAHGGEPLFYYKYTCAIYAGLSLVVESDGSCNSREVKYRYRNSERVCPSCGKAAIIKGKAEFGGGFLCFGKKGGCGAKFTDKDPAIIEQIVGKVANPDIADLVNTLQKMAQKRAYIGSALLATNASEFFTQDMEDFTPTIDHDAQPMQAGRESAKGNSGSLKQPAADLSRVDAALMEHCTKLKGNERGGKAWFDKEYGRMNAAEREAAAKKLGLTSAPAVEAQPVIEVVKEAQPANTPADILAYEIEDIWLAAIEKGASRKDFDKEVKRQFPDKEFDNLNEDELRSLKDGLGLWFKSLKK